MKKSLGVMLLTALCFSNTVYAKESMKTLVGKVKNFDCGDNCYLIIVDKKGAEHRGLCWDTKPCDKMFEGIDGDFGGYKGKMVKVKVGKGEQYDGAGTVMAIMDAFKKIDLLP